MFTDWRRTQDSLKNLEEHLKCYICNNILNEPWSLNSCDHSFCRTCITKAVNENSKCPQCGSFAWLKDLQINRELCSAVEFCTGLKQAINAEALVSGDDAKQRTDEDAWQNITNSSMQTHARQISDPLFNNSTEENVATDKVGKETEEFESWPLSGITMKKKKSVKTYEKRNKHGEGTRHIAGVSPEQKDINNLINAEPVYDEKSIKEIEDNFFKNDDIDTSGTNEGDTPVPNADINEPRGRLRRRGMQEKNVRITSKSPNRKSSLEKCAAKSAGQAKKDASVSQRANTEKGKKRSSISKVNKRGETQLHVAAIKGNYDKVKELLENGADPNAKDFAGWTPMHEACNHGCLDIVQLLLNNGAYIDIPGCDHDTPLHDAIANNRLEVAEFLISKGASLETRNKQGLLPMDYIKTNAAKEQLLLAASMAKENQVSNTSNLSCQPMASKNVPKCILHTGLDQKQKKILEKCSKKLRTKIVDIFSDEVTHIVTVVDEENVCNRTMKYLLGVLTGKWIASFDWIIKSFHKGSWENESTFEVKGCQSADRNIPEKARLNSIKKFPALFDGCSFYFSGEFRSNPSKAELLELIRLGEGVVLHREPKAETSHPLITPSSPAVMKMMSSKIPEAAVVAYHAKSDTAQSYCTQFIIYDPEASPNHKKLSTPIMCTAPSSWILDCISQFELVEIKEN